MPVRTLRRASIEMPLLADPVDLGWIEFTGALFDAVAKGFE